MGQWGKVGKENGFVFAPHIKTKPFVEAVSEDIIDAVILIHTEKFISGSFEGIMEKYIGMNYGDYLLQIKQSK